METDKSAGWPFATEGGGLVPLSSQTTGSGNGGSTRDSAVTKLVGVKLKYGCVGTGPDDAFKVVA
jgi:hypothetical protein